MSRLTRCQPWSPPSNCGCAGSRPSRLRSKTSSSTSSRRMADERFLGLPAQGAPRNPQYVAPVGTAGHPGVPRPHDAHPRRGHAVPAEGDGATHPGCGHQVPHTDGTRRLPQFMGNLAQLALLAVIVTGAAVVAGERRAGTAALMLCKPLSRAGFIAAKAVSSLVIIVVATALGAALCVVVTIAVFGASHIGRFLLSALV